MSAPTVDVAAVSVSLMREHAGNVAITAERLRELRRADLAAGLPDAARDMAAMCDEVDALRARVAALEAERDRYRDALDTIASTGTSVAPGMDAETSLRWTANDCIRTAARALHADAARDAGRARGEAASG